MNSTNQTEPGRPYFLWLDLETTGLNPKDDVVLEVGAVLTDRQLRPLSVFNKVCIHLRSAILAKMDDYVLKMHLDSGLLSEVWEAEKTPLQVLVNLSDWVQSELMLADSTGSKLYLAGSSISFDWGFLDQGLPPNIDLRSILHYRKVDVSVYKVCFPTLLKQPEGGPAHRVLEDINYSIDQQRQMDELLGDAARA
jgi:oligoribonuclease